jgi:hypothetical protein
MLNPSTADESQLDPTIRRCVGFTHGWGFNALTVVNLFALRSTDPAGMLDAFDPVGPLNDDAIAAESERAGLTVAAWGSGGPAARLVPSRARQVHPLLRDPHHLGLTAAGQPRHPLYLAGATQRLQWE